MKPVSTWYLCHILDLLTQPPCLSSHTDWHVNACLLRLFDHNRILTITADFDKEFFPEEGVFSVKPLSCNLRVHYVFMYYLASENQYSVFD